MLKTKICVNSKIRTSEGRWGLERREANLVDGAPSFLLCSDCMSSTVYHTRAKVIYMNFYALINP